MIFYGIDFIRYLLPMLLLMAPSAVPLAIATAAAWSCLKRGNARVYACSLVASILSGVVAIGLLFGSLFGDALAKSSTASLIFMVVPIYSFGAGGVGYAVGDLAWRIHARFSAATDGKPMSFGMTRRLVWVPSAILAVLVFGMLRYSFQHTDSAVAQRASREASLRWVYTKAVRGDADGFSIPLMLAQNPATPPDLLDALSEHRHPAVRVFVASHPRTHLRVLAALRNDCSGYVRDAVAKRMPPAPASTDASNGSTASGNCEQ